MNLQYATKVLFGSVAGTSFKRISNTVAQVRTPAHAAGGYAVHAVDPAGRYSAGGAAALFHFVAPPRIMRIRPTIGRNVRIEGLRFRSNMRVRVAGVDATHVKLVAPGVLTATAPRDTWEPVRVRVWSRYGWSAAVVAVKHRYVALPTIPSVDPPVVSSSGGGTVIRLKGGNLVHVQSVHVGGVAATDVYAYAGTVYAPLPAHAGGVVGLTVTTRYGTSEPVPFTYTRAVSMSQTPLPSVFPWGGEFDDLSCVGATFCLATDTKSASLFDGQKWSEPIEIEQDNFLHASSCVSPTFCVVVDSTGAARIYDGSGWSVPQQIAAEGLVDVSCASVTSCVAITQFSAIVMSGGTWGDPVQISPTLLTAVSCATASFCVATARGSAYIYDGSAWTAQDVDPNHELNDVSCPATTFCGAVDIFGNAVTFDGQTWSSPVQLFASGNSWHISCTLPRYCLATNRYHQESHFDGTAWSGEAPFDTELAGSTNGYLSASAVACTAATNCLVGDELGRVLTFDATQWSDPVPVLHPTGMPSSISCWAADGCLASDIVGSVWRYDGSGWTYSASIDPVYRFATSISCPSADFCALVDRAGHAVIDDAGAWSAPQLIDPGQQLTAVSCLATQFCSAVDVNGGVLTYDGHAWSSRTTTGLENAVGISCASATFCAAAGQNSVSVFDGVDWATPTKVKTPPFVYGNEPLTTIACPADGYCVAGSVGGSVRYSGGSWHRFDWLRQYAEIDSLSCPNQSFCLAVLGNNSVATYDGSTWSDPVSTGPPPYYASFASCISSTECEFAGGLGELRIGVTG